VTANLASGAATAVGGGASGRVSNIANVIGGSAVNTLTGNANDNHFTLAAGSGAIDGKEGSDSYTVTFGNLAELPAFVDINDSGTTGQNVLTLNGTSDAETFDKQITFVERKLTGETNFSERVQWSGINDVITLNLKAGNDTANDPNSGNFLILGGPGDDTIIIQDTTGLVTADGEEGSDTYIVNAGNLQGPVAINDSGSTGTDSVFLNGTTGNDAISQDSGGININGELISLGGGNLNLTVDGGGGTDTFAVQGNPPVVATVVGNADPRLATSTAISVSATALLYGVDGLTISAVVSGNGSHTGFITFYDGTTEISVATLSATGTAELVLGNTALAAGLHTITAVYSGDAGFARSNAFATISVVVPTSLHGLVYVDFNNDGEVNFGELAIEGATITLTGVDDLGQPVNVSTTTDMNGIYAFTDLRPSGPAGYTLNQSQPEGFIDGFDSLGTINSAIVGSDAVNDTFSGIVLPPGSLAENYNFGERPAVGGNVGSGQTATIGFWQNRNGQNLIKALNGGATATQLGTWLAATFPNMYASLDGLTNADVAAHYKSLFARNGQSSQVGSPKVDAQIMATALAVYVTNETLAGATATAFGLQVTQHGVGAATFNVGNNGAAFGVANGSFVSVMDLLLAVNARSHNGLLYDQNGDGVISVDEAGLRTLANSVFGAINESGGV
jgi:hypothetical protein